eukprot:gene28378-35223_t
MSAAEKFSSGGTVLGGTSKQQFNQIAAITNYDIANQTEINLRLIVDEVLTKELEEQRKQSAIALHHLHSRPHAIPQ